MYRAERGTHNDTRHTAATVLLDGMFAFSLPFQKRFPLLPTSVDTICFAFPGVLPRGTRARHFGVWHSLRSIALRR
jgi:hypothetical protein